MQQQNNLTVRAYALFFILLTQIAILVIVQKVPKNVSEGVPRIEAT